MKLTYGRRAVRGFAAVGLCACGRGALRVLGSVGMRVCGSVGMRAV